MAGIFGTPSLTPQTPIAAPSITDEVVRQAANDEAVRRLRAGRASTILTDPSRQRDDREATTPSLLGGR